MKREHLFDFDDYHEIKVIVETEHKSLYQEIDQFIGKVIKPEKLDLSKPFD